MRVLNVAEKPSVAKNITALLSSSFSAHSSASKYNMVYEFGYNVPVRMLQGQSQINRIGKINKEQRMDAIMAFTSVTGHLMECDFAAEVKSWTACDPISLLSAQIVKKIGEDKKPLQTMLETEARKAQVLVLWLDCDREGENIAFEVMEVCLQVNRSLRVWRAKFSALIERDLRDAIENLVEPDRLLSEAVDCRQEIDLRLGAMFTRRQSLQLQAQFPSIENVVSYGPCQFPTLGFVVKRQLQNQNFRPEAFWYIRVKVQQPAGSADFSWTRGHLFDRASALIFYELIVRCDPDSIEFNERTEPVAKVIKVTEKPTRKYRPYPLSTLVYQQEASRKLKMTSENAMKIAEALYQRGIISYPRTETDIFKEGTDLIGLVGAQANDPNWGLYAQRLLNGGFVQPKAGKNDDKAHPPIHPLKQASDLTGDERMVFDYITRRFLACCSADALGGETVVQIQMSCETFTARGLIITARNYLEVFTYDSWSGNILPPFKVGDFFIPTQVDFVESSTSAPSLLTEHELIALMDKHGIGTDATVAQHITNIQDRGYALKEREYFRATKLGVALVQSYVAMQIDLYLPRLRAEMEADITAISRGTKTKSEVLEFHLSRMRDVYLSFVEKNAVMMNTMSEFFDRIGLGASTVLRGNFSKCGACQNKMDLKKDQSRIFLSCGVCSSTYILPRHADVEKFEHTCPLCGFEVIQIINNEKKYHLCPKCYHHPPVNIINDIEDAATQSVTMPCFSCTYTTCPLAKKSSGQAVMPCFLCKSKMMILKTSASQSFFLTCKGYPNCKASINLPSCISITVSSEICQFCTVAPIANSENNGQCYLLDFCFKPGAVPFSLESRLCLSCDSDLKNFCNFRSGEVGAGASVVRRPVSNPSRSSSVPAPNSDYAMARQRSVVPNVPRAISGMTCFSCGETGHMSVSCPRNILPSGYSNSPAPRTSNFTCFTCGAAGHMSGACPQNKIAASAAVRSSYTRIPVQQASAPVGDVCYKCNQPGHWASNCKKDASKNSFQAAPKHATKRGRKK